MKRKRPGCSWSLMVFAVVLGCGLPTTSVPASQDCSVSTCPGCCFNGLCYPGTAFTACGKGGGACVACASYQACKADQTCGIDPEGTWRVQPVSATITAKNPYGEPWAHGLPNPLAVSWCPINAATLGGTTPAVTSTLTPTWSAGGCSIAAKDLLTGGAAVMVWDFNGGTAGVGDGYVGGVDFRPNEASLS